jgi:hypothetical protein
MCKVVISSPFCINAVAVARGAPRWYNATATRTQLNTSCEKPTSNAWPGGRGFLHVAPHYTPFFIHISMCMVCVAAELGEEGR